MDKIKKTNMNIKKITIAMLITLISIGNINAQEMKTEIPKISEFPPGIEPFASVYSNSLSDCTFLLYLL